MVLLIAKLLNTSQKDLRFGIKITGQKINIFQIDNELKMYLKDK